VAGIARGSATITAARLTAKPVVTSALVVQPVASAITAQSGSAQNGGAGLVLGQAVRARVLAVDGLGVQGIAVTFGTPTGGGLLSSAGGVSDANGDVSTTWTLGGSLGSQRLGATAAGVTGAATLT